MYHSIPATLQAILNLPPSGGTNLIRAEAARALLRSSSVPSFAALVVSHWRELPGEKRLELIQSLAMEERLQPLAPRMDENLSPILRGTLIDKNPDLQTLAAYSLLRVPGLSEDDLRRIARLGLRLPSGMVRPSDYRIRLALYRGAGMAGRRVLAEVLSEGQAVAEDRTQLALCLLDPDRFSPAQYWESTGNLQRDAFRRRAVWELMDFVSKTANAEPLDELATWLGRYLVSDLESQIQRDQAATRNRFLDDDRMRFLANLSGGSGSNSRWMDGLAGGLSASSSRVRLASAMAIVRIRGTSPEFVAAATSALLRQQDPVVMLRILAGAMVVPQEVASLVRTLAAGETPAGWREIPREGPEEARALLAAAASNQ